MKRPNITPCPSMDERQPFDDSVPNGLLESTNDWYDRNTEAVKWLIEHREQVAALPEVLDALEEMYRVCNVSSDSSPHRVKARAALTKAGYTFPTA